MDRASDKIRSSIAGESLSEPRSSALEFAFKRRRNSIAGEFAFNRRRNNSIAGESQLKLSGRSRRNSISRSIATSCARAFGMLSDWKRLVCNGAQDHTANCGVPFALKFMRKKNIENRQAWHSEIQVKKTLIYDHPYCVRIERVYETRKEYLMMMEYCSTDLHEALERMEKKKGEPYSHDAVALVSPIPTMRWRWSRKPYSHDEVALANPIPTMRWRWSRKPYSHDAVALVTPGKPYSHDEVALVTANPIPTMRWRWQILFPRAVALVTYRDIRKPYSHDEVALANPIPKMRWRCISYKLGESYSHDEVALANPIPTMRWRWSRESYSHDEVALVTHRVAQALQYIHSQGVVHRDLKPENILKVTHNERELLNLDLLMASSP
eukprot:g3835.t1